MIVKALYRGYRACGLYVGAENVRRYFSKKIQSIELQLDHLTILCGLTPDFWLDKPEIQDPRLCLWLQLKYSPATLHESEKMMAMVPTGKNSFKLIATAKNRENDLEISTQKSGESRSRLTAIVSA